MMHRIVWQKINNIKHRVLLELREHRGKLIVQPGDRSNSYFTCGLSQKMAEITNPSQFPGSDMMSVFWEKLTADREFMNSDYSSMSKLYRHSRIIYRITRMMMHVHLLRFRVRGIISVILKTRGKKF